MNRICPIVLLMLLASSGCDSTLESPDRLSYPNRPIKVIVPFAAGGGTDTFARTIQQAISDAELLPQPIVIINVPGASGTIGSRRVLNARPDGYTLLCLHEAILTAKYSGKVAYGPEAFVPIAGTGSAPLLICVPKDSSYSSLSDLMQVAQQQPDSVVFSANLGAPSQFAGLMLEKATPGALFRYTQHGGGAKRFAALMGGHADVSAFSLAEFTQFEPAGLQALAICSLERHPSADNIPTAIEQGFDCVSMNTQFWWAPKGTDPDRTHKLAAAIKQAMQQESVLEQLKFAKTDPVFLSGIDLMTDLHDRTERIESVSQRPTIQLPDFPVIIGAGMLVLALLTIEQSSRDKRMTGEPEPGIFQSTAISRSAVTLSLAILTVIVYVIVLQKHLVDFRVATILFLTVLGGTLMRLRENAWHAGKMAGYVAFVVVFTLGLHGLFTRLLVLDLP